jgi:uncharacterized protein YerC
MPHISKKFLQKEKYLEIHKQFYKILGELSRTGNSKLVFDELFTKTEKLMLAKRLAIVLLLDQKESIYAIENALKVSPSTVARISLDYEQGKFTTLVKEIKKQTGFWSQMEKIIPPRTGRNRFKNFLQF